MSDKVLMVHKDSGQTVLMWSVDASEAMLLGDYVPAPLQPGQAPPAPRPAPAAPRLPPRRPHRRTRSLPQAEAAGEPQEGGTDVQ